jgi:NAD(P)-dependent dehydrogenase (short-subunit alcohol dehydrogenase family)
MSANLEGKVAVVTGSTRGIGRAIADALAGLGAEVIITARRDEDVARVVREMTDAGHKARGIRCDTRSYEDVEALMKLAAEGSGGFDILVNNAGIGIFGHISEVSPDQWDQVIDTNLTGVFYCCHAALPYLKKRGGGYILNISSLAGKNAFKGGTLYNASKFGLEGLSEALMLDLRYENIKVSYIMPGSVATEFSGREPSEKDAWKLTSEDVARVVTDLIGHEHRALASRVELRPFQPRKV